MGATFGVSTASAQVDYEIMASLQFNFSNPGARSLAMAGALTGAGDDATGAWTNPGGLTNITRPEVGVELRGFNFSTPFVFGGRFNGTPTGRGVDTVNGLTGATSEQNTHSLSFVSAVVPKDRFAFAFYRTEVANFETAIETQGAFYDPPSLPPCTLATRCARILPVRGDLDLQISNFGGSAAVRLTDQVSVGVGVSFYDFNLDSTNTRFAVLDNNLGGTGDFFGAPGTTVSSREFINGEDTALGINVGASISPNDKFRIGASYRQGPKFDISYRRERGSDGSRICLQSPCEPGESEFKVPDVIAVGVLVKPVSALNVTVDFRRIQYSKVTEGMKAGFIDVDPEDYGIADGNEIRAAAEYLITNLPAPISAIAVRGGVWRDPDHRITYSGSFSPDTILFPEGQDETHGTFGAGIVFEKFQLDVGFDRAESVKTFSVSAVLRF
jgi:long-subunit fatty acid transport protein